MDWFDSLIEWLKALWRDFSEFMLDLPVLVLQKILTAIAAGVNSIPVPDFAVQGLGDFVSDFPSTVLWAMEITLVPQALTLVGSAVIFRLLRKLFTLGQW